MKTMTYAEALVTPGTALYRFAEQSRELHTRIERAFPDPRSREAFYLEACKEPTAMHAALRRAEREAQNG